MHVAVSAATLSQLTSLDWWRQLHHYVPIGVVGAISWSVWLIRFTLSRVYRPVTPGYTATTSVVVPSYREDPDILDRCLDVLAGREPDRGHRRPRCGGHRGHRAPARRAATEPRLMVLPFVHRGKRSALGVGIRHATGEILLLADSDTSWEPGLLRAVLAPFADPEVGGVGTRQNAYLARTSVWRRIADWMIDVRYLDYVPRPVPGGRRGLPVRPDGRLPPRGGAAGAREPGR